MVRTPYEEVAFEADRLIVRMALASSIHLIDFYWEAYLSLLQSYGWTDLELDTETLKRIDVHWRQLRN